MIARSATALLVVFEIGVLTLARFSGLCPATTLRTVTHEPLSSVPESKRDVLIREGWRTIEAKVEQDTRGLIEKFIAIHENNVAALARVKLLYKPRSRSTRNFAGGNQKYMIQQNLAVGFWIENRMIDGHSRLR